MPKQCQAPDCNNPVQSHGFCFRHGYLRQDEKAIANRNKPKAFIPIKKTTFKTNYKATGEGVLFTAILATRRHISFISGLPIDNADHSNCHHVLPKKNYEAFRLLDRNIILVTQSEHFLIHAGTTDQREKYAKKIMGENGVMVHWEKLEDLKQQLLME